MVVNRLRHFEIRLGVGFFHNLARPLADLAVDRHQTVRLQPATEIVFWGSTGLRYHNWLNSLRADGVERERHRYAGLFQLRDFEMQHLIALLARQDLVMKRRIHANIRNALVWVPVRNRNP